MRRLAALTSLAIALAGCTPSYSPDTYASNAAQQANKVEEGVIAGVRPVQISAQGTVGGVAGAAAGGVAGAQVGVGPTSAFTAIGGSLIGGMAGVATEHIVGDTNGFEYMVRKANGDLVSVAQKEDKPLRVGQKVLVIAGPQARIVPDYTVPFDPPAKTSAKPPAPAQPATAESHPPATDGTASHPPTPPAAPAEAGVPPQLPAAFGSPSTTPPPIIVPPETVTQPMVSPSASTVQKPP
jgi:outer membrane lipoprotein SlyB